MLIRLACPEDVHNGLVETLNALSPVHLSLEEVANKLLGREHRGHHTFVAVEGHRVFGTVAVVLEEKLTREGRPVAHIEDVVVRPAYQGLGVGKALLQHALEFSRASSCYKAILDCDESVCPFYEKSGFYRNGVAMRLDVDALTMHKELEPEASE